MRKIVLATNNPSKVKELNAILANSAANKYQVLTLSECGFFDEIVEDADTFEGNAYKKASEVARYTGITAIADDSGLEVDALNGAPGVYSARYAGENASDAERIAKLLDALKDVPAEKRTAHFTTAMCAVFPNGEAVTKSGACNGVIIDTPLGENGFGYDPVFFYPPANKTFSQMSSEDKNAISHRFVAASLLVKVLDEFSDEMFKTIDKAQTK